MDEQDQAPPEVTIEPADNGWVVRHHQRSSKKDTPGRTIRRVASTDDEALAHAKTAMSGSGGSATRSKKKSNRAGLASGAEGDGDSPSSVPTAHASRTPHRSSARRRRARVSSRRA